MFNSENAFSTTRRSLLGGMVAAAMTNLYAQSGPPRVPPEPTRPARQDLDIVASFVTLAHQDKNLDRVAEMVAQDPKLVYAAWDWGGGDWETGLGGASHVGSRKMARFLLEKGARVDAYCAAMLGEQEVVAALVTADPAVVNARGPHGYSLLYHAAISGDVRMAEMLGPHVANRKRDFNQSLSAAVRDGHVAMTVWLLENGVSDPNQGDGFGKRPLTTALEKGFVEVAEVLRKHGAREKD
ncbi:MAG TPA: ankyrin repeat domain-containing protein [Bryobacteraceae bacterium]|nr:ankyrin repeat domain-containing protein [Bryobacteraceae bacterium]